MSEALRMCFSLTLGAFVFFVCYYGAHAILRARQERRRRRLAGKD